MRGTGLVPGTHHSHQPRLRGEDHPGRLGLRWVLFLISLLTDALVAEVWSQIPCEKGRVLGQDGEILEQGCQMHHCPGLALLLLSAPNPTTQWSPCRGDSPVGSQGAAARLCGGLAEQEGAGPTACPGSQAVSHGGRSCTVDRSWRISRPSDRDGWAMCWFYGAGRALAPAEHSYGLKYTV